MSHKITTTTRTKTDTVIVHKTDSVSTHDSTAKTDTLTIDSATVDIILDTATVCCDTAKPVLTNPQAQMIHDLVKAVAGKQKIKSVKITVHGLKKTGKVILVADSTNVHKTDSTHAARDSTVTVKDVKTTSYLAFGIIFGLALLVILAIKFKFI